MIGVVFDGVLFRAYGVRSFRRAVLRLYAWLMWHDRLAWLADERYSDFVATCGECITGCDYPVAEDVD